MPYIDPTGTLGGWMSYPHQELGYTQFVPDPPAEDSPQPADDSSAEGA